ncbi:class I SAM-dependent methyltransferase [Frankia sp. Cas4]|uniref:class I SAM-dependent methyltransferase n=1 Tax=Frankia sp. Cas4 TaxID=3073927 RepID=UPI002AD54460|nr:class I SAM-dependent methyltransferase [Frankia sp. Cas4]
MEREGAALNDPTATAAHWDNAYARGERTLSWFEPTAAFSVRMIEAADVDRSAAVIDIGGGASRLVDTLLGRGFSDLTVLDVSTAAEQETRRRLGERAARVRWLVQDVRRWRPDRIYRLWHDRAVFHFNTARADLDGYLAALDVGTAPGSVAVFATFAPDGPTHCSGLPVARYSREQISATLGDSWQPVLTELEQHTTPSGAVQPFTWTVLRRR